MMAHTVLLLHAGLGFTSLEQFTNAFRLPVVACSTRDGDGGRGLAMVGESMAADERDFMASTLYDLYRMIAAPNEEIDDPRAFARARLGEIRKALNDLELALDSASSDDETAVFNAAESLSYEAEQLAFGLYSWDAQN